MQSFHGFDARISAGLRARAFRRPEFGTKDFFNHATRFPLYFGPHCSCEVSGWASILANLGNFCRKTHPQGKRGGESLRRDRSGIRVRRLNLAWQSPPRVRHRPSALAAKLSEIWCGRSDSNRHTLR